MTPKSRSRPRKKLMKFIGFLRGGCQWAFYLPTVSPMSFASQTRQSLSQWITFLLSAAPIRSRTTFIELLCACLISPEGWVTRAISAICREKHWTTYYKLIERGNVRLVPIARALFSLIQQVLHLLSIHFVLDDSLVPRHSKSAPGSMIRHDHVHKNNRPEYLLSQCWLTLGICVLGLNHSKWVLPLISRSVPITGQRNKLNLALALVRALSLQSRLPMRMLFDSWFMRARLV